MIKCSENSCLQKSTIFSQRHQISTHHDILCFRSLKEDKGGWKQHFWPTRSTQAICILCSSSPVLSMRWPLCEYICIFKVGQWEMSLLKLRSGLWRAVISCHLLDCQHTTARVSEWQADPGLTRGALHGWMVAEALPLVAPSLKQAGDR